MSKKILLSVLFLSIGLLVFSIFFGRDLLWESGLFSQEDTLFVEDKVDEPEQAVVYNGVIHLDYPVVSTSARVGDMVLAPDISLLTLAFEDDNVKFNFEAAWVLELGETDSTIEYFSGGQAVIPNSLIIVLGLDELPSVGDRVLTWNQSSLSMSKAIILSLGNEDVLLSYLSRFSKGQNNVSFDVLGSLTGEMEVGASVFFLNSEGEYEYAFVVNMIGDKVLLKGFNGVLFVLSASELKLVPLTVDLSIGDDIYVPIMGLYRLVTVVSFDLELQSVLVEHTWAGEIIVSEYFLGDVLLTL